jgi:ATP-dependent exoDNAse (exonuclease V) beta subunit
MIKFIEDTHRYLSDTGELISVSKFLERFKEKVDWNKIAKRTADKLTKEGTPTTLNQVLAKWARKRDESSRVGTLYHSLREKELVECDSPEFYGRICSKRVHGYYDGDKHSFPINDLQNNTVYPELMIYDTDYMICGQSDKVIVTDNQIHIWDYKTDKEITFKAFSNQWVKPKKLLYPLDKLDDANGNHYAVKMSLYMYLLWKVLDESGLPIVLKIEQIKLPYLKKEVMAMLKTI